MTTTTPPTALITGGSSGLGLALALALDDAGWIVVTDARDADRLRTALEGTTVHGVPGDVAEADHRAALVDVVAELGGLDLLVLNSSILGPLPMRPLAQYEPLEFGEVFRANAGAPGSLMVALTGRVPRRDGMVIGISLGRRGAALRDLGRVRRLQGRPRPPRAHLRRRDRARDVRRGPGRHAHPDAAGRLPGRGHLRPPAPPDRGAHDSWRWSTVDRRRVATSPPRSPELEVAGA